MTRIAHEAFAAFVDIDWAETTHAVSLQTAGFAPYPTQPA
jgi:hypothetical protein